MTVLCSPTWDMKQSSYYLNTDPGGLYIHIPGFYWKFTKHGNWQYQLQLFPWHLECAHPFLRCTNWWHREFQWTIFTNPTVHSSYIPPNTVQNRNVHISGALCDLWDRFIVDRADLREICKRFEFTANTSSQRTVTLVIWCPLLMSER